MSLWYCGAGVVLLWACFLFTSQLSTSQSDSVQMLWFSLCNWQLAGVYAIMVYPTIGQTHIFSATQVLVGTAYSLVQDLRENDLDVLMMVLWALKGSLDLSNSVSLQGAMVHYLNDWHSYALWMHLWQHVATHALVAIRQLWKDLDSEVVPCDGRCFGPPLFLLFATTCFSLGDSVETNFPLSP